jgi:hypothetical protein
MGLAQHYEKAFKELSVRVLPFATSGDYEAWKDIQELVAAIGKKTNEVINKPLSDEEKEMEVAQECGALIGRFSRRGEIVDEFLNIFLGVFKQYVSSPGRFEGNLKIGIAGGMSRRV